MKRSVKAWNSVPLLLSDSEQHSQSQSRTPGVIRRPGLLIRFAEGRPEVLLSGTDLQGAVSFLKRRELIDRLFRHPKLEFLRINTRSGEIRLKFSDPLLSRSEILELLAQSMKGARPNSLPLPHEDAVLGEDLFDNFAIRRTPLSLSFWQIDSPSDRFFRISHPLLGREYIRKQVLDELATLSGYLPRSIYLPLAGAESLIVFLPPHRFDPLLFQEVLDPVLTRCLASGPPLVLPKLRDVLVNANLSVALFADLLLPPLGLINIVLTVLLSAGYVPRMNAGLRQGKITLDLLYLVIAFLTVITYQFLPAALMYWLMRFWPRRSRVIFEAYLTRFVARYRFQPRRVWIDRDGSSLETRIEDLSTDGILTLQDGDVVPGDGVVLGGQAKVDEQLLSGQGAYVFKSNGQPIYAATHVVEGTLKMQIRTLGTETATGRLARWYQKSWTAAELGGRTRERAEKTVLPVLAISALAAFQGGLTMAKATIRPDYATGPALADELDGLAVSIQAAREGILLGAIHPLATLAGSVTVVFDDSVDWALPSGESLSFSEQCLKLGLSEVVFLSGRSAKETARLAGRLGFHSFYGESSSAIKSAYVAQRQRDGRKVVYVGDSLVERGVAQQADLAITVVAPPFADLERITVALLTPDLTKFLKLRALAQSSERTLREAFALSAVPNVAAILAAFFLASPVYGSIFLSNLGSWANYLRSENRLYLTQHRFAS